MRFIVADDSSIMRDRITSYIDQMGHEVIGVAFSAKEGYELCLKERPDVAIFDVLMPPWDGKKTALKIVEEELVKIMIITSSNSQDMVRKELEDKGILFIKKPLTQVKFTNKVKAVVDGYVGSSGANGIECGLDPSSKSVGN